SLISGFRRMVDQPGLQTLLNVLQTARANEGRIVLSYNFFARVARQGFCRAVDGSVSSLEIVNIDRVSRIFEEFAIPLLTFTQSLLSGPLLGDVLRHAYIARHLSGSVAYRIAAIPDVP